ncbi:MAG: hypothetical protein LBG58_07950 [Planctomycetaceae bacterium]|jgi:hypothetical protein|nr:hypothetical protein [Planctomycetaceae bacterium]
MTKTSTLPNCIGCRKMSKLFGDRRRLDFFSVIRVVVFSIFFILSVLPSKAQDEPEKTTAEKTIAARKENKESRLKKSMAVSNLEREVQESTKKIPWNAFSPQVLAKVRYVVSEYSLFRRMPQQKIYADPEMFQFLSEHPDLVVGFWEKLGVTQISLQELNQDQFIMKETTGTTAVAEVIYRTKDICIVYAKGLYKGPFLVRSYDGEVVLILRNRFMRDANNEPVIVCDLDVFIRIDHLGVDFLAKLFATTLGKIADNNFEQTVAFVGYVSESAGINAESVKRTGYQVKNVRETVREDFGEVVDRVAMRIARRNHRNIAAPLNNETENYPIPIDAPFAQKQANQIKPTDNSMILAVSSEKLKQEFDETFHYDSFFTIPNSLEKKSLEEKKNETIQFVSSGFGYREEWSNNPIPESLSTLNNSTFDDEASKTDYNTTLKNRAIFTTPKIAR